MALGLPHLTLSLAVTLALSGLVWLVPFQRRRWLVVATVIGVGIVVGGTIFGWPLYPLSDVVVLAFGLSAGMLLGRVFPLSPWPFFVFLVALSLLDVAQNLAFSGPTLGPASPGGAPDSHLIWLNFRVPLPAGNHLNIGFADLILIAAMTERLRRYRTTFAISALPGVAGLLIAEVSLFLYRPRGAFASALLASLVPFLTVGWLLSVAILKLGGRWAPAVVAQRKLSISRPTK